jgi:hypothetical protein
MNNRAFVAFIAVFLSLGLGTGYRLSTLPKLETYKLLNLAGLFYDFLGVVVLSEMAATHAKWKKTSVEKIAPTVLWFHMVFPLGAILGSGLAAIFAHPASWTSVSKFALGFWGYSIIPLSVLDATVTFPRFAPIKTIDSRWRWFGLFLLLSGVGMQLIAALLSLTP